MTIDLNSQINEARDLFNKAFRLDDISKRNDLLNEGIDKFNEIEEQEIDDKQREKISHIRFAYTKQLIKSMRPTPSVGDDMSTFMILVRLHSDLEELFDQNPNLKTYYDEFKESLHRSPEFHRILSQLKKQN